MKQKTIIWMVLVLALAYLTFAPPPALTDFQLFHGTIADVPEGDFTLKAKVGADSYSTPITAGVYGVNPTFKVYGDDGDAILFYVVDSTGRQVLVGNSTYSGDETAVNFAYSGVPGVEVNDSADNESSEEEDEDEEEEEEEDDDDSSSGSRRCTQRWSCGAWSICSASSQSRICTQTDACGNGSNVNVVPKPEEQRSCVSSPGGSVTPPASNAVCSSNSKRCLGKQLQQCSGDGMRWQTLQTCQTKCDTIALACDDDLSDVVPPDRDTEASVSIPTWVYYAGGSGVLLIAIIFLVLFMLKSKGGSGGDGGGALKGYVASTRAKGFSDIQIRARLRQSGKSEGEIDKAMR